MEAFSESVALAVGRLLSDMLVFCMAQTITIQVRGRGPLTLPATLREQYRLGDGGIP